MVWDANKNKSDRAIALVVNYERRQGQEVNTAKRGTGYDLLSWGPKGRKSIEVKGTKKDFAIPDLTSTEFSDEHGTKLKATHLYVVGNVMSRKPQLYIITRRNFCRALQQVKNRNSRKRIRWHVPGPVQEALAVSLEPRPLKRIS
ncbi:MAG: protein NO VEIN domain-containing protein [Nitrospiraceae bacterium]